MKKPIVALMLVAAAGAGVTAWYRQRGGPDVKVVTAQVTRGDIVDTVGATGAMQAVTTVLVGSQVSGNIQWLGADFNSIVKRGQVIARLDPSIFDAQLQQVEANLSQTQANLVKAQSELDRSRVQLADAEQKFARASELSARKLLPQSELDAAKVAVDIAQASVASQQATVTQTRAAVTQSQASVNQAKVNRDHTIIVAPIDGIVTQRNVDVGQTVAASMQAPTLFVIAADLKQMQVLASVDEADVGRIRPNQRVTFRVDAYPTEAFSGFVSQVRLQPTVVQNVTTYGTLITAPNPQLRLKPGMTATVKIEVARRTNVLRVPNLALRFRPTSEVFAALHQTAPGDPSPGGGRGSRNTATEPTSAEGLPAPAGQAAAPPSAAAARTGASTSAQPQTIDELFAPLAPIESRARLWLFIDGQLKPVNVRLGVTDGSYTELLSGDLPENTAVVTSVSGVVSTRSTAASGGAANPLIPARGPGGAQGGAPRGGR